MYPYVEQVLAYRASNLEMKLGGLILEGVAVLAGELEQQVEGPRVGQLAQGPHGPSTEGQVADEVDAGQEHVQQFFVGSSIEIQNGKRSTPLLVPAERHSRDVNAVLA